MPRFLSFTSPMIYALILVLAGCLQALSFAPEPQGWLQIFALALLAGYLIRVSQGALVFAQSPRQQQWYGALGTWLFATGNFATGIYWIFISLHTYGGMPAPLAAAAVALLAGGLALYAGLAGAVSVYILQHGSGRRCWQSGLIGALAFAATWTLAEWLRGTQLTGFPWLNIGYAHIDGWLGGWAPLLGVYGIAALAALCSGLLAAASCACLQRTTALPLGLLAAMLGLSGLLLGTISWGEPVGQPIVVRLVQSNIAQDLKFDEDRLVETLSLQARLAAGHSNSPAQLIVLPETAIPVFQDALPATLWLGWIELARRLQTTFITGVPVHIPARTTQAADQYFNSVIALDGETSVEALRQGHPTRRYDKHHLVPFGEFVPRGFRWFVDTMVMPLGDFTRGAALQQPFVIAGQRIAPNICYEDVFGEELLGAVRHKQATILLNVSNLAWFGDSWALTQHLNIARMRSRETARPMLRATNTGMTAAIDASGRVIAHLPAHQTAVLQVSVQGWQGATPYQWWGNKAVLSLVLLVLSGLLWYTRRQTHNPP